MTMTDTEARHAAELRELKKRFSEVAARVKSMLVKGDLSEAFDVIAPFILPTRELSGSVMQAEKYLFHLSKWGVTGLDFRAPRLDFLRKTAKCSLT